MNVRKRAFAYLFRKKGKTVSLFLVVFFVAVFLISCFGVLNASKNLGRDIRTSLGAAFYIRANTEVSMTENGETEVKENSVHISQKKIDEIMQTGEIKYYNPINYGFAKSDGIEFVPGDKHTGESNMGKVTALNFSALAPDFTDEMAVLTEGKHITDMDYQKILISEELASVNHLLVGDTLTLTHARLGEANGSYIDEIPVKTAYVQVEVSGIYRLNTEDASMKPTACVAQNKIYASLDVLNELHESEKGIYTGEVDFYITDPTRLESIIHKVLLLQSVDWKTHFIRTNDLGYLKIAEQLSSLGNLVKILLALVSIVSTAFLILLLTMRMRSRGQEVGILLAVGISKEQIMAGFLLEVLTVTVIALGLSYITCFGVTDFLGYSLFRELQPNLLNEKTLSAGEDSGIQMNHYLRLNVIETLFIYLCQIIVITASVFVSSGNIMRWKPSEILSKIC